MASALANPEFDPYPSSPTLIGDLVSNPSLPSRIAMTGLTNVFHKSLTVIAVNAVDDGLASWGLAMTVARWVPGCAWISGWNMSRSSLIGVGDDGCVALAQEPHEDASCNGAVNGPEYGPTCDALGNPGRQATRNPPN